MSSWTVQFHEEFAPEFWEFSDAVQEDLVAAIRPIERLGPHLGRPLVDTLKGSKFPNMKELRFRSEGGVWRVAFAFDPERKAILLVGGDKSGISQKLFYKKLLRKAEQRFTEHLARTQKGEM